MAFTWGTMTDAIAGQMAQVPGIGRVYKQRRVMRTEQDLNAIGVDPVQKRLNCWMVSPSPANTTITTRNPGFNTVGTIGGGGVVGAGVGTMLQTLQFQIEGWYGLKDKEDSETAFRDLSYAVTMHFNRIGLLTPDVTFQLPCDVETFGYTMFAGGVLAHYARIGFGLQGKVT